MIANLKSEIEELRFFKQEAIKKEKKPQKKLRQKLRKLKLKKLLKTLKRKIIIVTMWTLWF